jgi:hypothetical protein
MLHWSMAFAIWMNTAFTEAAVPRMTVYEPFSPESLVYLYLPPHGGPSGVGGQESWKSAWLTSSLPAL